MNSSLKIKLAIFLTALVVMFATFSIPETTLSSNTQNSINSITGYKILNPYESVNWINYGQYKASLHAHTTESDGAHSPKQTIEDHYRKGYDILAITDHDFISNAWNRTDRNPNNYLTTNRLNEINTGVGRNGRKMISIPFTNEQSMAPEHLNTFWADFNNDIFATLESNIANCENLGGISFICHPGGAGNVYFQNGQITSRGLEFLNNYINLFIKYPSCIGMEVLNKRYGNREDFRLFWDNILMQTMPERPVWGFSNDDSHAISEIGFNFNMMLMPENTVENIRFSMENGTFYAVALLADNILDIDFETWNLFPYIKDIEVNQTEKSITITAENYDIIEWVADNKIIATGNSINLKNYEDKVNSYVRAQLKGLGGVTFTQPFGILQNSHIQIGDVNLDGRVNSTDYVLIKRHILEMEGYKLECQSFLAADIDRNGIIDTIDLVYMRRYILGIITTFPVGL
ncbi:UNVERIFIED_CONTAM: putative metal-dependent phosphoesterases (PHP family) [Acetivibrio alkalicellulosi]